MFLKLPKVLGVNPEKEFAPKSRMESLEALKINLELCH